MAGSWTSEEQGVYLFNGTLKDLSLCIDSVLADISVTRKINDELKKIKDTIEVEKRNQRDINCMLKECEDRILNLNSSAPTKLTITENNVVLSELNAPAVQDYRGQPQEKTRATAASATRELTLASLAAPEKSPREADVLPPVAAISLPDSSHRQSLQPRDSVQDEKQQQQHKSRLLQPKEQVAGFTELLPPPAPVAVALPSVAVPSPSLPVPSDGKLTAGMTIYARRKHQNNIWYKAQLLEVIDDMYKVKFTNGKVPRLLPSRYVAFPDVPARNVRLGTRIIALYKEQGGVPTYYGGIVAEPPYVNNSYRFLVFFDDGCAQYCTVNEIRIVYHQSKNVWEDVHPDSQDFIKNYLSNYNKRIILKLSEGQVVKTEWNGKWWKAKVNKVDASLVQMHFEADRRYEWIYRGSTRLEPLYNLQTTGDLELRQINRPPTSQTSLLSGAAPSASGSSLTFALVNKNQPVQPLPSALSRNSSDKSLSSVCSSNVAAKVVPVAAVPAAQLAAIGAQSRGVARKSTSKTIGSSAWADSGVDGSCISQDAAGADESNDANSGERVELPFPDVSRCHYKDHQCGRACMGNIENNPSRYKERSPLYKPFCFGFERQVCKLKTSRVSSGRRRVCYRAPCGRRLRNAAEVDLYLMLTDLSLTIDLFSFDPYLNPFLQFVPKKTYCDIKDLSYGKETTKVSCVNAIDRQYPDYVEYSTQRLPTKGVQLNLDANFLTCCDCTDNCQNKANCACHRLTYEGQKVVDPTCTPENVGYQHRRLSEQLVTGIYECNSRCHCDSRCPNRVVQNGLSLRLQVFKTQKRGWGLRCLDDVPEGCFVCIYAGQLLTEHGADEDGKQYGDEYMAELDFIETVEKVKEGYESDVNEPGEGSDSSSQDEGVSRDGRDGEFANNSDSEWRDSSSPSGSDRVDLAADAPGDAMQKQLRRRKTADDGSSSSKPPALRAGAASASSGSASAATTAAGHMPKSSVVESPMLGLGKVVIRRTSAGEYTWEQQTVEPETKTADWLNKLPAASSSSNLTTIVVDDSDEENDSTTKLAAAIVNKCAATIACELSPPILQSVKQQKQKGLPSVRRLFGEPNPYVMDAKSIGNLGRYLNHSCTPNVFVQNVFVDTHDLRLPWVAFFSSQFIRCGEELTWDYGYEQGVVPGKVLYCFCGATRCRGRLL